jgi:predicted GH43/DUF377 family glycosyl hydrolase
MSAFGFIFILLLLLAAGAYAYQEWRAEQKSRRARTRAPGFALDRSPHNPTVSPLSYNEWEACGTFNPAALQDENGIHLFYRAVGTDGVSRIGYAHTSDGHIIDDRTSWPVYSPRYDFEGATMPAQGFQPDVFSSGGGWGGCEDPKVTEIDGQIHMTYVANGNQGLRVALTSLSKNDFDKKRWNWSRPRLISKPDEVNKSAVILPEKIDGMYVIFHRVFPDILIDYVKDLNELGPHGRYLSAPQRIRVRPAFWDSRKISIGATPLKTDLGWLIIYHAVDDRDDSKYQIGAMIVAHDDPARVLYRSPAPILSPDVHYENDWKPGIAYPSGAAIMNDELFVYYGGGDKYVCVAKTSVKNLVDWLVAHGKV